MIMINPSYIHANSNLNVESSNSDEKCKSIAFNYYLVINGTLNNASGVDTPVEHKRRKRWDRWRKTRRTQETQTTEMLTTPQVAHNVF